MRLLDDTLLLLETGASLLHQVETPGNLTVCPTFIAVPGNCTILPAFTTVPGNHCQDHAPPLLARSTPPQALPPLAVWQTLYLSLCDYA
jgi:hypothetical protein